MVPWNKCALSEIDDHSSELYKVVLATLLKAKSARLSHPLCSTAHIYILSHSSKLMDWPWRQQQQQQGYAANAASAAHTTPQGPAAYQFVMRDVDDGATAVSSFDYGTDVSDMPPLMVSLRIPCTYLLS